MDLEDAVPYDEEKTLYVRRRGAIGEVIFNRPEVLNAVTPATGKVVRKAFTDLSEDDDLKVIIFRGMGRSFSTGMEVSRLGTQYFQEGEEQTKPTQRRRLGHDDRHTLDSVSILHSSKVVISEGKGHIMGISMDWFLDADITICSEGTVFGYPPSRMIAATGNTLYWMLRMGAPLHAEMTLMGRYIKAEEAFERGLINRVVPADKLEETVTAAADAVCCIPADGLAIGKFNRRVAWEILGVRASQLQTAMAHALQVQQRIDKDDWHLVRERDQHGSKGAFQRRDARFKDALARYWPEKA
jgi:enoyl-CoA hydratase